MSAKPQLGSWAPEWLLLKPHVEAIPRKTWKKSPSHRNHLHLFVVKAELKLQGLELETFELNSDSGAKTVDFGAKTDFGSNLAWSRSLVICSLPEVAKQFQVIWKLPDCSWVL